MPSALNAMASLLEEVGEASCTGSVDRRFGVVV